MADEFKIVASLNIPESASRINKDIPKLEGQAKHLKIIADLDPKLSIKNIQTTLNKMNNNANIKIGIDTSGLNSVQGATQNITNGLKNVQTQAQQTASSLTNLANKFKNPIKPVLNTKGLINAEKTIEEVQKRFAELGNISVKGIYGDKLTPDGLEKMIVNIKNAQGEVRTLTFQLGELYKGQKQLSDKDLFYLTNGTSDNGGVEKFIQSIQKAQDKIKALRTDLASTLKSVGNGYSDPKAVKPIIDDTHLKNLNTQYVHALRSIADLKNADDTTMASMKANAESEIEKLKQMVKQYQNAEYAATSLRTKDIGTNKSIQTQELDKFISKISSSKPILDAMTGDISQLKSSLNSITDTTSFTKYLNELDIAKSKFESLKAMYQSIGSYSKQLDKLAQDWQKQGIYVGNVKTTIESLKTSLANVTTANGLTNWVNDFKTQIGAINEMPIKVMECKQKIAETSKEWYKQGILVKDVAQEMSAFKQSLSLISSSGEMEQWNKNWDSFIQRVAQAKGNLDKQVESYNNIYSIQAKIAKLNPTKDSAEIARLNEKLKLEQSSLSKLQQQSNIYTTLISQEQQEKYITEQTVKARDKLLSATNTGVKQYQTTITNAITELQGIANSSVFTKNASNPQVTQTKQDINSLITAYQNLMTKLQGNITPAGLETVRTELTQLNARFNTATATAKQFETELRNDNGAEKLAQRVALLKAQLEALAKANPKALTRFGNEINSLMATLNNNPDGRAVEQVAKSVQLLRREINNADLAGKTFFQNLKEKAAKFTGWMSMTYAISLFTRSIRQAITELKEVDTLLTEISKANDKLTKTQLAQMGSNSFGIASKYGKQATDYLKGVQEMSRAGYTNAEAMGELSTAAQGAGDMTADVANQFIIAADKAYKMNGSVETLTKTLDGINYITNNNAVNMSELSEGFSIVSSTAASFGVRADELSAALGTMAATTQQSGSEVARAFRAILLNIRQVSDKWLLSSNQFAPYVQKCA